MPPPPNGTAGQRRTSLEPGTWSMLPRRVRDSGALRELTAAEGRVLIALVLEADWADGGRVIRSQEQLGEDTGLPERSVRRAVCRLACRGVIEALKAGGGRHRATEYVVVASAQNPDASDRVWDGKADPSDRVWGRETRTPRTENPDTSDQKPGRQRPKTRTPVSAPQKGHNRQKQQQQGAAGAGGARRDVDPDLEGRARVEAALRQHKVRGRAVSELTGALLDLATADEAVEVIQELEAGVGADVRSRPAVLVGLLKTEAPAVIERRRAERARAEVDAAQAEALAEQACGLAEGLEVWVGEQLAAMPDTRRRAFGAWCMKHWVLPGVTGDVAHDPVLRLLVAVRATVGDKLPVAEALDLVSQVAHERELV